MITKCFIVPYFGEYPEWMPHWERNTERMRGLGYDFLFDTDEAAFQDRVRDKLGIECPPMTGTGNIWEFRPALGVLYADEISEFSYWGHTDFDVLYGRVEEWVTDDFLDGVSIHSNHHNYICGFWSLYANEPFVNNLFRRSPDWQKYMEEGGGSGWAETEFTRVVDEAHAAGEINRVYTHWQTKDLNNYDSIHWDGDRLMEGNTEVFTAHFRRTKQYPSGAIK